MIPKSKAETEAQLRPIGLRPYIYWVWIAIRKQQSRGWSLRLRGGTHIGATVMASRTRASIELQHYQGQSRLCAFSDCSKPSERVGHAVAGSCALNSGLPGRIANMIFDMYGAARHVKAHAQTENRGFIAG